MNALNPHNHLSQNFNLPLTGDGGGGRVTLIRAAKTGMLTEIGQTLSLPPAFLDLSICIGSWEIPSHTGYLHCPINLLSRSATPPGLCILSDMTSQLDSSPACLRL